MYYNTQSKLYSFIPIHMFKLSSMMFTCSNLFAVRMIQLLLLLPLLQRGCLKMKLNGLVLAKMLRQPNCHQLNGPNNRSWNQKIKHRFAMFFDLTCNSPYWTTYLISFGFTFWTYFVLCNILSMPPKLDDFALLTWHASYFDLLLIKCFNQNYHGEMLLSI